MMNNSKKKSFKCKYYRCLREANNNLKILLLMKARFTIGCWILTYFRTLFRGVGLFTYHKSSLTPKRKSALSTSTIPNSGVSKSGKVLLLLLLGFMIKVKLSCSTTSRSQICLQEKKSPQKAYHSSMLT